jgi:hypothetical protein
MNIRHGQLRKHRSSLLYFCWWLLRICFLAAVVVLFVSRSLPSNRSTRHNTYCGQNAEFLNAKAVGTYNCTTVPLVSNKHIQVVIVIWNSDFLDAVRIPIPSVYFWADFNFSVRMLLLILKSWRKERNYIPGKDFFFNRSFSTFRAQASYSVP